MNTNDLPPAARLASLIEAGRAAHPHLTQSHYALYTGTSACAIGFAKLAAGVSPEQMHHTDVCDVLHVPDALWRAVARMNDRENASIEEICQSLREGALAKVAA